MAFTDPNAPIIAREFATDTDGTRIDINGSAYPAAIALYSGNALEITPALVRTLINTASYGELQLYGPALVSGTGNRYASLVLGGNSGNCTADLQADQVDIVGPVTVRIGDGTSNVVIIGDTLQAASATITGVLQADSATIAKALQAASASIAGVLQAGTLQTGTFKSDVNGNTLTKPVTLDTAWTNLAFSNGWVVAAGSSVGMLKDGVGNVQLRGVVSSGTAGAIATLPVGYRPTTVKQFSVKSNNDASSVSWLQVTATGVVQVVGNLTGAQVWCALDEVRFTTL